MEIWGAWKGKMEGKWKSEKWKFLMQGNYIKKARSCEQALEIVCGKVAIVPNNEEKSNKMSAFGVAT